jgi:hypothetical protein
MSQFSSQYAAEVHKTLEIVNHLPLALKISLAVGEVTLEALVVYRLIKRRRQREANPHP